MKNNFIVLKATCIYLHISYSMFGYAFRPLWKEIFDFFY